MNVASAIILDSEGLAVQTVRAFMASSARVGLPPSLPQRGLRLEEPR